MMMSALAPPPRGPSFASGIAGGASFGPVASVAPGVAGVAAAAASVAPSVAAGTGSSSRGTAVGGLQGAVGTVPCIFQLLVHEAVQVPSGCRALRVAWRKGVKEVSTPMVEVQGGRVEWEAAISLSSLLFKGAGADGKVRFQTKFCWLEVSRDGGDVLGHAQLDLAEYCDGHVHERSLQVWKTLNDANNVKAQAPLGNLRVRISVEARPAGGMLAPPGGSALAAAGTGARGAPTAPPLPAPTAMPSPPQRQTRASIASSADGVHVGSLSPVAGGKSPQFPSAPKLWLPFPRGEEGLPDLRSDLEVARPGGGVTPSRPATVTQGATMAEGHVSASNLVLPDVHGATSIHADILQELPARLVALCNRQCLHSHLSSVEQEDALRVVTAMLRRSHEPLPSCGVLFSTIPVRVVVSSLGGHGRGVAPPPAGGGTVKPVAPPVRPDDSPAGVPSAPPAGVAAIGAQPVGTEGFGPPGTAATVAVGVAPPSMEATGIFVPPGAAAAATKPPLSMPALATVLGGVAEAACTRHLCELLGHLADLRSLALALPPVADDDHPDSPGVGGADDVFPSLRRNAAAFAAAGKQAPPAEVVGSPPSPPFRQGFMSPFSEGLGKTVIYSGGVGLVQRQPSVPVNVMVSQIREGILWDVDQASGIGERVLEEISGELGELLLHLQEAARDRDLWAQRFLASRELQYSSALFEQAARIDHMDFAVASVA